MSESFFFQSMIETEGSSQRWLEGISLATPQHISIRKMSQHKGDISWKIFTCSKTGSSPFFWIEFCFNLKTISNDALSCFFNFLLQNSLETLKQRVGNLPWTDINQSLELKDFSKKIHIFETRDKKSFIYFSFDFLALHYKATIEKVSAKMH